MGVGDLVCRSAAKPCRLPMMFCWLLIRFENVYLGSCAASIACALDVHAVILSGLTA